MRVCAEHVLLPLDICPRHAELCEQLMKHNAVPVISDLGINTIDATISRDCTLALLI